MISHFSLYRTIGLIWFAWNGCVPLRPTPSPTACLCERAFKLSKNMTQNDCVVFFLVAYCILSNKYSVSIVRFAFGRRARLGVRAAQPSVSRMLIKIHIHCIKFISRKRPLNGKQLNLIAATVSSKSVTFMVSPVSPQGHRFSASWKRPAGRTIDNAMVSFCYTFYRSISL